MDFPEAERGVLKSDPPPHWGGGGAKPTDRAEKSQVSCPPAVPRVGPPPRAAVMREGNSIRNGQPRAVTGNITPQYCNIPPPPEREKKNLPNHVSIMATSGPVYIAPLPFVEDFLHILPDSPPQPIGPHQQLCVEPIASGRFSCQACEFWAEHVPSSN